MRLTREVTMSIHRRITTLLSILALLLSSLHAETLNLSPAFVSQCKNRATISIQFELDRHLNAPHKIGSSGDDGDIHMAGRAPEVQLPMVAEIVNAGLDPQSGSVSLMNQTASGQTVPVTGVWRIWFEHPSPGDQTQGDPVDVPANTNPDHVFEIHPITSFGNQDIANSSFMPIDNPADVGNPGEDYQAYPAAKAFGAYEKLQATISVSDSAVSITAQKAGYNYTEFLLEPVSPPAAGDSDPGGVPNGTFVLANIFDVSDPETPVTATPHRMVFVNNTQPAAALQNLAPGQMLHVLGIPRVNLSEVAAITSSDPVDMALPYEIIVVAVIPDGQGRGSIPSNSAHASRANLQRKPKKPANTP